MIEDVSNRMLRDFATCLQAKLTQPADQTGAAPATARPVRGMSLFFAVLWERLRRLFSGRGRR
jgi:hypothetical protein